MAHEITVRTDTSRPIEDAFPEFEKLKTDEKNSKLLLLFVGCMFIIS
jgi:hypothetical protein